MNELLAFSKSIRSEANNVLSSTQLISILSSFGQVEIIGSFRWDLMYDRDLDIIVMCEDRRNSAISALNKLIQMETFSRYEFGDFLKYSKPDRPNGYILELHYPEGEKKWELEVWFMAKSDLRKSPIDDWMKIMTDENVNDILSIKKERAEQGISKKKLSSYQIYQSVIVNKAKNINEVLSLG